MTTTTHPPTTEAIVCPPWCVKHWPSDEQLGNPDGTFNHWGNETHFGGVGVALGAVLDVHGRPVEGEPICVAVDADDYLNPPTARRLAAHLLNLADLAEQPISGAKA